MTDDSRLNGNGHQKVGGATVYLMEELGDARMRCDQLVRYVNQALRLIEKSPHKDHFYQVAGHLIQAAPLTLFKLQKALQAVALAANRIDYEEIKTELRPEKVEQLERVLEDVRIRQVQRHSEPPMTPQQVAAKIRQIAATTREFQLPQDEVVRLILALEEGQESDPETEKTAALAVLEKLADTLDNPNTGKREGAILSEGRPSRLYLAGALRRLVGDDQVWDHVSVLNGTDSSRRVAAAFDLDRAMAQAKRKLAIEILNPLKELARLVEEGVYSLNRGEFEQNFKIPGMVNGINSAVRELQEQLTDIDNWASRSASEDEDKRSRFEEGKPADPTENMSPEDAKKWKAENEKNKDKFKSARDEEKDSKFEEGKPADPTKNMSPEDAKKWKAQNEEHKDEFKSAASNLTKVQVQKLLSQHDLPGEVRGSGAKWEVELPDEKTEKAFMKVLPRGAQVGGFKTGYGGWVLRPGYKVDDVDFNDPSSRHHYAAGAPQGKAQVAIMDYLGDNRGEVELTDMSRHPSFRGVHFAQIMSGAEALKKKGLIEYDGKTVQKKASEDGSRGAGTEMKPKYDPSYQQQLSLMMKNPPRVTTVEGANVIEIFSPFVKKYIPQAEYPTAESAQKDLGVWQKAHRETLQNLRGAIKSEKSASEDEDKQSRFEEGKPADPTENMSPEDAKKWKSENEKNKDKFKGASDLNWKA